ncbi:brefeldin A-inhibited guanine nucleotide-exchange protein 3-like, partial [Micropterus salmoides]|uniref:brefeldin A-inhibited guanine nucleotide-exchange protein 3-like n=1 Tax=Micropterus salmoides TaxID=27706 RepID=UPI0018EB6CC8
MPASTPTKPLSLRMDQPRFLLHNFERVVCCRYRWLWSQKNTKLGQTALTGMQKLLCEDRFVGGVGVEVEVEALEKQLLSQMLEAIRVTPSLHEDLQVGSHE